MAYAQPVRGFLWKNISDEVEYEMKNKTIQYLHNFSYHLKAESDDCFFIHSKHFKPQTYIDLSFPRQFPSFSLLKKVNSNK